MKKFVRVVSNYDQETDDFSNDFCIQEELIPVRSLIKIYKRKGGKPVLTYVWVNPVTLMMLEWHQIFHSEKQRDALFDKLEKKLC